MNGIARVVALKQWVDAYVLAQVNQRLPQPYMVRALVLHARIMVFASCIRCAWPQDEPFHVQQTQQYCAGHFGAWDPKITTFPGLYLVGTAWTWAQRSLLRLGISLVGGLGLLRPSPHS
jgi:hypothetical protein